MAVNRLQIKEGRLVVDKPPGVWSGYNCRHAGRACHRARCFRPYLQNPLAEYKLRDRIELLFLNGREPDMEVELLG